MFRDYYIRRKMLGRDVLNVIINRPWGSERHHSHIDRFVIGMEEPSHVSPVLHESWQAIFAVNPDDEIFRSNSIRYMLGSYNVQHSRVFIERYAHKKYGSSVPQRLCVSTDKADAFCDMIGYSHYPASCCVRE
jgi:hypothetical protein